MAYTLKRNKPKTFDFKIEGSKKIYHVPVLSALPVNTLAKAKELRGAGTDEENADKLFDFFTEIFRGEADEVLDVLTIQDFAALFEAYVEASNTDSASAGE